MVRYILYRPVAACGAQALDAAKTTARGLDVKVVRALADSMLVEAEPTQIQLLVNALPGWCLQRDRKTARIPERRLQRLVKSDRN